MSETTSPEGSTRGVMSGIMIILFSALLSTIFFGTFFTLAYLKKMPYGRFQAMILQVTSILFTVVLTQYLSKKIQGDKLKFMQGFLGGWLASLVLAIFVNSFYAIFSKITGTAVLPKGAFAMVLMLYSAIGVFVSLVFAFILKKE